MLRRTLLSGIVLCAVGVASAEVANVSASGFAVKHEAAIKATPERVYSALTGEIGLWWNPDHTYSHDSKNLSIEARPGGCFCEKLPNGGGVQHMTVVFVSPGNVLRMTGTVGPLQASGLAGSMTWKLTEAAGATRLELAYSVGGYMQGGFEKIAPAVDAVLSEQLTRLKAYVETGKPAAK